jgi:methyl-accepting chemotaxis protein
MLKFKDIKFVRKLQAIFFVTAFISVLIGVNSYVQTNRTDNKKNELFKNYVNPNNEIHDLFKRINSLQFTLLKFSIPAFGSDVNKNIQFVTAEKDSIEQIFKMLSKQNFTSELKTNLDEMKKVWTTYKNVVCDAIISAAITKDYEMAAVITTTSGEEVAAQIEAKSASFDSYLSNTAKILDNEITASASTSRTFLFIGLAAAGFVIIFTFVIIVPSLTKPIDKINHLMTEHSGGQYTTEIISDSKDEFGQLMEMLNTIKSAQLEKIAAAKNIAAGIFEKVTPASEFDELAFSFNTMTDTIRNLSSEISNLTKSAIEGQLSKRATSSSFGGEYREILSGINKTIDALLKPAQESIEILNSLANGNLNARITGDFAGDHKSLKNSINSVGESLYTTISQVNESITSVSNAGVQISASTEEMAAGASEQGEQTNEVASAIEEMTKTIIENSRNAAAASDISKKTTKLAAAGKEKAEFSLKGMLKINEAANSAAKIIGTLTIKAEQIGEITQVINDIADQTNLLALNAAIEAARAGEQGRGFAVVADEVRKLAERTTKATKEIAQTINAIQKESRNADLSMQEARASVDEGRKITEEVQSALDEILESTNSASIEINNVAVSTEQQSINAEQISKNIEIINNVINESAKGTQQIAREAENLRTLTDQLKDLIERFQIDEKDYSTYQVRQNGRIV